MIFWLVAALLAVGLGAALALPLLGGARGAAAERGDFDAAIYRDQLAEIERDRARGTLSDDQAASARLEVERRLLSVAGRDAAKPAPHTVNAPLLAAGVAVAVPALALILYLQIGAPGLPGQPFDGRRAAAPGTAGGEAHQGGAAPEAMDVLVERLAKRLQDNPDEPEGWSLLARSYQQLERHRDAVAALERAVAVSRRDPQYVAALGEARIMAANGTVPPQARAELDEVLKAEPNNPRARFYLALAEAQSGNLEGALDRLVTMARETPPDAPYLAMLRDRIGGLAREMKRDPEKLLAQLPRPAAAAAPRPPMGSPQAAAVDPAAQLLNRPGGSSPGAAPERGPSAADVAAAQAMSPEARQQMIRGMVEGLAARLESEPGDVEGWLRLMRAYKVQGDDKKAADVAAKAASANPAQRARIAATAQQLGIATAAQPVNPIPPAPRQAAAPILDAAAIQAGAPVAPDRLSALRQLLLLKPDDREALFQVGLAESTGGNKLGAAELWGRLIAQYPPQSPEYRALRQRLDGLR
jgi:cytochrome c-type biogenesis protein CcmH